MKYKIINNDKELILEITGNFLIDTVCDNLTVSDVIAKIDSMKELTKVGFDVTELKKWDSSILTFLKQIKSHCVNNNIIFVKESLPSGIQRVLELAEAVPERKGIRKIDSSKSTLELIGDASINFANSSKDMLEFLGEVVVAFLRLISGRYKIKGSIIMPIIRECSVDALPIVSLISCLVGFNSCFCWSCAACDVWGTDLCCKPCWNCHDKSYGGCYGWSYYGWQNWGSFCCTAWHNGGERRDRCTQNTWNIAD
jgi:phospholipid/cholesterol/gamma-HCH transport system permease protein